MKTTLIKCIFFLLIVRHLRRLVETLNRIFSLYGTAINLYLIA